MHRLHFDRPRDEDLRQIDEPLAAEIAARLASVPGARPVFSEPGALWDLLERWAGIQNLEERMVKRGFIDPAVLQVLRDTTGGAGAISDRGDSRE